jgi:hypothetical protein
MKNSITKHVLLSFFSFLIISFNSKAQNNPVNDTPFVCAGDEMMQNFLKNKANQFEQKQIEEQIARYMSSPRSLQNRGAVVTLPVVVHIIHNGGAENISDAQVLQGIQDLNEAFANKGYYDPATGVNTDIQFCLAQRGPNNQPTNGITRDISPLTNMTMETDDIALKNINRWTPSCYINIWLLKEINSNSIGSGVAGYAYLPSAHRGRGSLVRHFTRKLGGDDSRNGALFGFVSYI